MDFLPIGTAGWGFVICQLIKTWAEELFFFFFRFRLALFLILAFLNFKKNYYKKKERRKQRIKLWHKLPEKRATPTPSCSGKHLSTTKTAERSGGIVKNGPQSFFSHFLLTQRHDGKVFATELAGNGDLLPQCPATPGVDVVSCCWRVMAHLEKRHTL